MRNQTDDVLEIELTTKCVLQCPACSRMHDIKGREIWDAGHLDKEVLFKIADTIILSIVTTTILGNDRIFKISIG